MKTHLGAILLLMSYATNTASCGTMEIDLTQWNGQYEAEGWTTNGMKISSLTGEYKGGMQFSGMDYWLQSPCYSCRVTRVALSLCCNATNDVTRILTLHPVGEDGKLQDGDAFDVPAEPKKYEVQFKDVSTCVDQFRLAIMKKGSGKGSGNWYVKSIVVEYDETQPIEHQDVPDPGPQSGAEVFGAALTNCWKLSRFIADGENCLVRTADFSFLASVGKKMDWTNGVSIASFYAFSDSDACAVIGAGKPSSTSCGLYAVNTNDASGAAVRALSMLGTTGGDMKLLLPIELDGGRRIEDLTIRYRGWKTRIGETATTLAFSWCKADALGEVGAAGWKNADEGSFADTDCDEDAQKSVILPGREFRGSRFVCLRWSVLKQGKSSMLGIYDVQVAARMKPFGFSLQLR